MAASHAAAVAAAWSVVTLVWATSESSAPILVEASVLVVSVRVMARLRVTLPVSVSATAARLRIVPLVSAVPIAVKVPIASVVVVKVVSSAAIVVATPSAVIRRAVRWDHHWLAHIAASTPSKTVRLKCLKFNDLHFIRSTEAKASLFLARKRWSATLLRFRFLDVNAPSVDLGNLLVFNKALGNTLVLKSDEPEAARLTRVDVIKNDGVLDLAKLAEMLLEALFGQFKVETAHKYLALGVGEGELVIGTFMVMVAAIVAVAFGLVVDDHVGVGLLDLLAVLGNMDLLSVVSTAVLEASLPMVWPATKVAASLGGTTLAKPFGLSALVVLGGLDVDLLVQDEVAFLLVLHDDLLLE